MTQFFLALAAGLLVAAAVVADGNKEQEPAERLRGLRAEYDAIGKTYRDEQRADRTDEGFRKANEKYNAAMTAWQAAALAAVRRHPDLPEAYGVIAAVLDQSGTAVPELVGLLRKHHAARPDLGRLFHGLIQSRAKEGPEFVEEMAEKSPVEAVRAQAAYAVGWQAKWRVTQDGDESLGFKGKLADDERKRLEARAEKYLALAAKYDDAPMAYWGGKVGPTARGELLGLKNLADLQVGKAAPDIAGEGVDGKKLKLSDHRGKVTVVVFWASWCGPCMKMVPHEKELVERHKDKPFALVGVNGDDEREKAKEAAERTGMTWPSFWDAAERPDGPITKAWNVSVWPTVFVLDAKGVIRFKSEGDKGLDQAVDELLKEMEAAKK